MPKYDSPRSLAFIQFKIELTNEIRKFWMKICSLSYAEKYLNNITCENREQLIGDLPEHKDTFLTNLNLKYTEFVDEISDTEEYIRQDSIVNIISIFESYIFNAYQRMIAVKDTSTATKKESEKQISISIIENIVKSKNPIIEFANVVTSQKLRNKKTSEMVKEICDACKSGARQEKSKELSELNKYVLLRNSIVHNSRFASQDLENAFGEYESGKKLATKNREDVLKLSSICLRIIESIDNQYCKAVIKDKDACLLAKEIFIVRGLEKGILKNEVYNKTGVNFSAVELDAIIAEVRRESYKNDFIFSPTMLN